MTAQSSDTPPIDPAPEPRRSRWHGLWLALLAAAISFGWFQLDGDIGINLADEGYLWYGAQAVARGEVPMRDFQAYDPGRYLWVAGWSRVLGRDLVALRLACVIFSAFGVTAGLLVAWRLSRHWLFLVSTALLLCAWMHPRFKCFEQSIALMSVYAGVLLLERPTTSRCFSVGIFGGLMAFMGRNHGAYHLVAFALLIALAARGRGLGAWMRDSFAWVAGIFIGYMPQLLMFKVVPGYLPEFRHYLTAIALKGTNLFATVPWPWRVDMNLPNWRWASALLEGCFFVALPLFLLLACWRLCQRGRARAVLAAAACVTLPYAHFAFSRPDSIHLGHTAPTLALGLIALAFAAGAGLWKVATPVLLAASLVANFFETGLARKVFAPTPALTPLEIQDRPMNVDAEEAQFVDCATALTHDLAHEDERVLFLPNLAGLYPATGRTSPIRQLYCIFPATLQEQSALVSELEAAHVQWVMLRDYALDGRKELRFRETNPLVFAHLSRYFAPYPMASLPTDTVVLRRTGKPRQ